MVKMLMVLFTAVVLVFALAIPDSTSKSTIKKDSDSSAPAKKVLSEQKTCPIMGGAINKKYYVDYKGKRIYVCCPDCIDAVKKDPKAAIKKLESLGEAPETVGVESKKESKDVTADAGYWTCTMHPEIHKTESGKCPICGMTLVFKKSDKGAAKTKPMHHGIR